MSKFHTRDVMHPTEIVLKIEDINKSKEFYQEIMGFKILKDNGKEVILTTDSNTPIITLVQPNDVIPKLPRRTGLYHFAILLPDRIQLGLFLKHISAKGYPIIGGSNHGVSEAIYLEDPDNNGIEVYADTNVKTWKWEQDRINMTTLPLDYKGLIADTKDLKWQGIPEDTIMGHIHLHVADLNEAKRFYVDGLGFDLVMDMANSALFISSGGYHHHLGLNIWNGRGSRPLPENSVGMKYYNIRFPREEIRQDKINRLRELNYEVFEEEGEIFTKDPSDNLIKLVI